MHRTVSPLRYMHTDDVIKHIRVTGPLLGGSAGDRWPAGDLRRNRAYYDANIMSWARGVEGIFLWY